MSRLYRPEFVEYQIALDKFTSYRAELNELSRKDPEKFKDRFYEIKQYARMDDVVCMDVLAYYYKSGVRGLLPENYERYLQWEVVAAAKGNELAIEKLQFLLDYAYNSIMQHEEYDKIVYKNDIDDYNTIYVLGKAVCKMLAREHKLFPIDMGEQVDEEKKYTQESFIKFRKQVDEIIPKTIAYLLS